METEVLLVTLQSLIRLFSCNIDQGEQVVMYKLVLTGLSRNFVKTQKDSVMKLPLQFKPVLV
ncbi:MAG: hypothetical protein BGO55_11475 [Sphingobacteriales bacterium 50-39]|nr:MAG: hypothetical protein BGO55_11475 [Sphingobacteriales bacterium 50-39]